jgi:purine-nucleoside phosphorylase
MFMPYKELSVAEIEAWLDVTQEEIPEFLVLHCTWPWSSDRELHRYLTNPLKVGNTQLGNFWVGTLAGHETGYIKAYGSGMVADMLYILIQLGVHYVFQIGSMGSLQQHINIFDLVIPSECVKFEGLETHFLQSTSRCNEFLLQTVTKAMETKAATPFYTGQTISIDFLFAENTERVTTWSQIGLLAIDMETATTYAVCHELGAKAIAVLLIIDNLVKKGELISNQLYQRSTITTRRDFIRDIIGEAIHIIAD